MADKLKAIDIAERILQASDIIASEKLKHLNYDRTINGTIVSADNATNGEYTVDDGSTTFLAYSKDTDYKVGDSVYITVQNGDWSLQKLITGRYVKDDTKPFAYKSPLDSFLDITDNLVGDGWRNQNQWALLANSDLESPKRYTSTMDIWKIGYTYTKENVIYSEMMDSWQQEGYTKVAISANFRTRLQDNTISGDYGLELILYDFTRHQDDSVSILPHIFTFSCRDMFGNPYNFLVNSTQSIVLNLDNLNTIVGAKIVFYQRNNFKDADKQSLVPNNLPPNIFLSNLYVSFGYAKENFDGETVLLYSLGKDTYLSESLPKRQDNPALVDTSANERKMSIRWIHQNDDLSYNCIDQPSEIPWYQRTASEKATKANIHFYRYNLDENDTYNSDSDSVGELAWKELNTSPIRYSTSNNKFAFSYTMNPALQHEMFKVLIEYPTADYITNFLMPNDGYSLTDLSNELNTLETLDNPTDAQSARIEEIEAIINSYVSQIQYYESNILEFINESQVPNLITLELVKGLRIECDKDGYNGNFQCYRDDSKIVNEYDAYKVRFLKAIWNTANIQEYDGTEDIYWYIPADNTMIAAPVEGKTYNVTENTQCTNMSIVNDNNSKYNGMYCIYYKDIDKADTGNHAAGSNIKRAFEQAFQIKDNYLYSRNNNKVYCVIHKNNHDFEAEFDMTFGISGNNGTKYTFNLEIADGKTALTYRTTSDTTSDSLKIIPHLYNQNNTPMDIDNITYSWYSEGTGGVVADFSQVDNTDKSIVLTGPDTWQSIGNYESYILQASTRQQTGTNRWVNLSAYLPIAIRRSKNYETIEGNWTIVYNSSGTNPFYYKDEWKLHQRVNGVDSVVANGEWTIRLGADTDNPLQSTIPKERYYPKIEKNILIPTSLKMSGIGKNINAAYVSGSGELLWIQPLMITSYAYESELMNTWNGSLTMDEKNGTILSAMIGAGIKNNDNTFSGVFMGDARQSGYSGTNVGLYGYHFGEQSFAFKVDGTAFLGKSGSGRIEFDGNNGTIRSSAYATNGTEIDLNNGIYRVRKNSKIIVRIQPTTPYVTLTEATGAHTLLQIADNSYYLATSNFNNTSGSEAGVKIDLGAGRIEAYNNFKIYAKNTSGTYNGSYIQLQNSSPYFTVHAKKVTTSGSSTITLENDLIKIADNDYCLQSLDYNAAQEKGTKIDLANGKIIGYNLLFGAYKATNHSNNSGWIWIDSSQSDYPLSIGKGDTVAGADFKVNWAGKLFATGAEISGKLTATEGTIGGFTIGTSAIYNGVTSLADTAHNGVYLGTDGITLGQGVFKVTNAGALTATNATITGDITATSGSFTGTVTATSGSFTGTITSTNGTIGGFTIGSSAIYNGMTSLSDITNDGVYLGTDGIALGKGVFKVTKAGALTTTSGTIGGWTINNSGLSYDSAYTEGLPLYYLGPPKAMTFTNSNDWVNWDNKGLTQDNNTWSGVVFKAGKNFFVSSDGTLWANNGHFSGTIKGSSISGGTITGGYISGSTIEMGNVEFTTGGSTDVCAYDQNIIVAPSTGAPSVTLDSTATGSVSVSVSLDVSTTQIHTPADGNVDVVTAVSVDSVDVTFDRPSYVFSGYGYATKKTIHYVGWEES